MAMTLAEVRTQVRSVLNEATAAFWSDTEIDNWIKEASIAISMTGCVETTATVTLANSTYEYAVPTTFANPTVTGGVLIKVLSARLNDIGLTQMDPRSINHLSVDPTNATPKNWAHFGQRLFFSPVAATTTGTVDLLVAVKTDDITLIPDVWQPIAIPFAAARAKQKDGRFLEAATFFTEARQMLIFLRNDIIERPIDSAQAMRVPTRVERR